MVKEERSLLNQEVLKKRVSSRSVLDTNRPYDPSQWSFPFKRSTRPKKCSPCYLKKKLKIEGNKSPQTTTQVSNIGEIFNVSFVNLFGHKSRLELDKIKGDVS